MSASDSVVLELLARVQKCESDIKSLSEEINLLKSYKGGDSNTNDLTDESDDDEKNITRSQAREIIMDKIRRLIPNAVIRAGNRKEGSGIVVSDNKGIRKFKLYNSRSYDISTKNIVSWSGVLREDLKKDTYDGYIFSIWANELYVLLFTHPQLVGIINDTSKTCDTNNKYHFSFTILPDKKVFETRSPKYVDVSYSLDNYKIIE